MEKRKRRVEASLIESGMSLSQLERGCGGCAVCAERDARVLMMMELPGGAAVTLCGSHALMLSRLDEKPSSVEDVRARLADRRATNRRAPGGGDELAERLTAAFTRDRRNTERRAS